MSCGKPEPIPEKFYKPGDRIYSPGYSFCYEVVSGPLCRVYYSLNGCIEPHALESAWHKVNGKWQKLHPNYLSYRIKSGEFITVRWGKTDAKI